MTTRTFLITATLLSCLAACSVAPRYVRPDIPAPGAWRTEMVQTPPEWPSKDWWQRFGSTDLNDLIARAEHANDDLAAAIARVREADAQVRIAGAALLPSISAGASAARQRQQVTGVGPETDNLYGTSATASYELDFWGRNRSIRDAAKAAASASRYDRETVELTVMTSVAMSYFQALALRDRLTVARSNLASATTILQGLRLEQTVGTVTALDVAQQETTVATLDAAIPPLEEEFRQTVDALAILIGETPQTLDITHGTLADLSQPQVRPGLPSELLARRPDVAEAEADLIAANANIGVARAAFLPSIELTAAGGFASTVLNNLFTPANRIWSLGADLTQPIFAGGAISGQYAYTKARYAELLADYHKAVISAFGNVEDALVALQQTAEQLKREQVAVEKATRAYEISQEQMRAGTINILTVLNTETALFTAQDALLQVKLSQLSALVDLFKALGGGWQRVES